MEKVLLWMCIGLIAAFVLRARGHNGWKWFLLSLLLGPFGFAAVFIPKNKGPS